MTAVRERGEEMGRGQQSDDLEARDESADDAISAESGDVGRWPVDRLKPVLEAMIFAVADPLTPRRACDALDGATVAEVKAAAAALQSEYADKGIRLLEIAGGWQFRTAPEHQAPVRALFKDKPLRLTRAAIETLAIIAYKQPVTRAEIEAVRGVDSSAVLENLVERRIARIAGRRDVAGRPLVYATTPLFLELFGLKDLKALPTLAEIGDDLAGLAESGRFSEIGDPQAGVLPLEDSEEEQGEDDDATIPKVRFEAETADDSPGEAEAGCEEHRQAHQED